MGRTEYYGGKGQEGDGGMFLGVITDRTGDELGWVGG